MLQQSPIERRMLQQSPMGKCSSPSEELASSTGFSFFRWESAAEREDERGGGRGAGRRRGAPPTVAADWEGRRGRERNIFSPSFRIPESNCFKKKREACKLRGRHFKCSKQGPSGAANARLSSRAPSSDVRPPAIF